MGERATVRSSEFIIRSKIDSIATALLNPEVLAEVVAVTINASKGHGLAVNQLRVEGLASQLVDRGVEAFFPDTQVLTRITPQFIEIRTAQASARARMTAAIFFDDLVQGLQPLIGTTNAGTTTWSVHVTGPVFKIPSPPPPPLGPWTSTGYLFNYGTPPWEDSILATQFVVEPSTLIDNGTFLSLTNVWAKSDRPFVKRLHHHWVEWQKATNLELAEGEAS